MLVAITQRRSPEHNGGDLLEATYANFFNSLGVALIPMLNNVEQVKKCFNQLNIERIVLSGGGGIQPSLYNGDTSESGNYSPEREAVEKALLDIAIESDLPILGICRGTEFLNVAFGGKLIQNVGDKESFLNHRKTRHNVTVTDDSIVSSLNKDTFEVNSYHDQGLSKNELAPELISFATAPDNIIEGIYHPNLAIAGIMWHPERENLPSEINQLLIQAFLSRELFWKPRTKVTK